MKFTEAFEALGYKLDNPQNEWSAQSDTGVCITVWQKESGVENGLPFYEHHLDAIHPDPSDWTNRSGHKKRARHLIAAEEKFGGNVDVVLLTGEPGISYGSAEPWDKKKRGGGWKLTKLNHETGSFRVDVIKDTAA